MIHGIRCYLKYLGNLSLPQRFQTTPPKKKNPPKHTKSYAKLCGSHHPPYSEPVKNIPIMP